MILTRTQRSARREAMIEVTARALFCLGLGLKLRLRMGTVIALAPILALCMTATATAASEYPLHYTVKLDPSSDSAEVTIAIEDARLLREIDFNLDPKRHSDVTANGKLELANGRARWTPPPEDARLSLRAKISHLREDDEYDARMTDDWALFRGDDLIPPAKVKSEKGARSRAILEFQLPKGWPSVNAGWEEMDDNVFRIDNPERRFDRPTGWMIAGKLGTRRDQLGNTKVAVSAPKGSQLHRMDVLTFLNFVWPQLTAVFENTPPHLLIVGAGDPMWRGGLSASNSLFLHEDRPLVSENGTSPLMHELVHMVSRIRGGDNSDWIAEGLAEFYSVELVYRAGGMTDERRARIFSGLSSRGEDVETLLKRRSTGATTARATVFFDELDREIRSLSNDARTIDHLTQRLVDQREVTLTDIRQTFKDLLGVESKLLHSDLLEEHLPKE